jgi:hypothetical protein
MGSSMHVVAFNFKWRRFQNFLRSRVPNGTFFSESRFPSEFDRARAKH